VDALSSQLRRTVRAESEATDTRPPNGEIPSAMSILYQLADAMASLSNYRCQEAVQKLTSLPRSQLITGYVLAALGRTYMELYDYPLAEDAFNLAMETDPTRLSGCVEHYSTALWQMRKEVQLADLATRVVEIDRRNAAAWCVVGNCFSLQKDHNLALKFFKRATQLEPRFAYAHTLTGHEYASKEDFETAESSYRRAIQIDDRHYTAWYGIGNVHSKRERHGSAETFFRNALRIHPNSSTLVYHLGMALHAQGKRGEALLCLDQAVQLDPRNPVSKFERARVLSAVGRHDEALKQLGELNQELPREATVYYEIGLIHRLRGNNDAAVRYFTIALDLDPKERMYKKALDSQESSK